MKTHRVSAWPGQRVAGVMLIAVGGAFFLDQLGFVDARELWHYWPVLLIIAGAMRMLGRRTAGDLTSGLWTVFVGAWLLANFEGWFGIDFGNSWPFLLIAWGLTLLLRPVIARSVRAGQHGAVVINKENHDAS